MANSVDPDQTAPIGAVCSGPTLFASILNSSLMLDNYLQQMTSADDIFRCIFFLGALRVKQAQHHSESRGREPERTDPYGPQEMANQAHLAYRQDYLCFGI